MPLSHGVRRFRTEAHPARAELFADLAGGQQPEVLFVTCADSRIDPALITSTDPGSLFVCRNAGNVMPAWSDRVDGMVASVEYAVAVLGVAHVVVCGHSSYGAMGALVDPPPSGALPAVERWLPAAGVAHDGAESIDDLIARNARQQLEHLRTHPSVADRIAAGELELHAWVYDIGSGDVHDVTDAENVQPIGT